MNAELDATVGPILKVLADRAGVVITNADGDEPSVALIMVRFVRSIGYRPVLAGNVKGFLDHHRNPDTQKGFADAHGQRPFMVTSFADGTKLSLEATTLANATGFKVTKPGMEGRRLGHVRDLLDCYDPKELLDHPVVDYVLGAEPGSGAFVIGYNDDPQLKPYMSYFKLLVCRATVTAVRSATRRSRSVSPGPSCSATPASRPPARRGARSPPSPSATSKRARSWTASAATTATD